MVKWGVGSMLRKVKPIYESSRLLADTDEESSNGMKTENMFVPPERLEQVKTIYDGTTTTSNEKSGARASGGVGVILLEVLLKPGTPYLSVSLSLSLSPTDALQVELRRIWAMQRPDLNRLPDLNNCP
jgi:hypothetical protein